MTADTERTQFDYLLNAFEQASQSDKPAEHGYADKRRALYAYVRDLERRASADTPAAAPAERKAFEAWRNDYFGPLHTNVESNCMWSAWQARAALSAPVAAPPAASGVEAKWVGKLLGYLESQMFHPSASHVPPDFRDGYNHALRAVIERVEFERTHLSTALTGAAKDTK